jgi:hypothetical protein
MVPAADARSVTLIASHQDQVAELPSGAEVWLRTPHCPIAGYTLGPAALAIQPHPEFTAPISAGLVDRRREAIGAERSDGAIASLSAEGGLEHDRATVARWMSQFLRDAAR